MLIYRIGQLLRTTEPKFNLKLYRKEQAGFRTATLTTNVISWVNKVKNTEVLIERYQWKNHSSTETLQDRRWLTHGTLCWEEVWIDVVLVLEGMKMKPAKKELD